MKSSPIIALVVCLIAMGILLIPQKSRVISAIPGNLWTSNGQLGKPSTSNGIVKWKRHEYGIHWAWLVYDSEVAGSAWYLKLSPRHLLIYVIMAVLAGVFIGRSMKPKTPVR